MGNPLEIISALLVFLIFGWLLFHKIKWGRDHLTLGWLWLVYSAKFIAGISLIAVYTFYHTDRHTADIFKYFDDALVIQKQTQDNISARWSLILGIPFDDPSNQYTDGTKNWLEKDESWKSFSKTEDFNIFNSNRFITRIHLVLLPFTGKNIYLHSLFFTLISLFGGIYFFRLFAQGRTLQTNNRIAILLVFLLPSTLLWCSGMLKDTITLAALEVGFYLIYTKKFYAKFWFQFLTIVLILALCKYYVLPALVVVMVFEMLRKSSYSIVKSLVVTLSLVLIVVVLPYIVSDLPNIIHILNAKRAEALKIAVMGDTKEYVFNHFGLLDWKSFTQDFFYSIYATLFYPTFIHQTGNKLSLLFMFENWALWMMVVYVAIKSFNSRLKWNYRFLGVLLFSITLAFIIGYTTPVTGGLLRYKTAFWSLLFTVLIVAYKRKKQSINSN